MKDRIYRQAVAFTFVALTILSAEQVDARSDAKPNIVLILVDDMGYGDVGAFGGKDIPTPNIDKLADDGIRFTDGYVPCPVCGPSRVGLLSGAYPQRFGVQWNQDVGHPLPKSQKLISETLSAAGYVTGLVGKSNMPGYPKTTFDESMSVIYFGADYYPDKNGHYPGVDEPRPRYGFRSAWWGPKRKGDEYLTDRLGRQAVEFIQRHNGTPFFLYLAFNAPHSPFIAKQSMKDSVSHMRNEAQQLYAAMCISMDENIGRVLSELDKQGLRENTLVVFASDNGPASTKTLHDWGLAPDPIDCPVELLGSAGELNGGKASTWEGGVRVPCIISWPDQLQRGGVYTNPVSTLDFYPTFCAAAKAKVPAGTVLDGTNLLPYIRNGKPETPHEKLFWFYNGQRAMRQGKWKLRISGAKQTLYDLEADIGEQVDLARKYPEILQRMEKDLSAFCEQMPSALSKSK